MAINIQNLVAAANAKIAAGASDAADSARLVTLTTLVANHENTLTFKSITDLPTADSSNAGLIFRVASLVNGAYTDSSSNFYLSYRGQWKPLSFTDSAVAQSIYGFQGSNYGYTSGGLAPTKLNIIDKFSFTSDGNATDVGDLTAANRGGSGQSSSTHGYHSGGADNPDVEKFSFTSDGNASEVFDLFFTIMHRYGAGHSSSSNGYASGGEGYLPADGTATRDNIQKFPFASDTNATDIADLTQARYFVSGLSSTDNGYASGGQNPPAIYNIIDKFPFSSDTNATDVGDLTKNRTQSATTNSANNGYVHFTSPAVPTPFGSTDKFPFASDVNATEVSFTWPGYTAFSGSAAATGVSSTEYGYIAGGNPGGSNVNHINKFTFASDGSETDVGDLTSPKASAAGQQY